MFGFCNRMHSGHRRIYNIMDLILFIYGQFSEKMINVILLRRTASYEHFKTCSTIAYAESSFFAAMPLPYGDGSRQFVQKIFFFQSLQRRYQNSVARAAGIHLINGIAYIQNTALRQILIRITLTCYEPQL